MWRAVRDVHANAERFDAEAEMLLTYLQVFTACVDSFAHGANDVANACGPFAAIWGIYRTAETAHGARAAVDAGHRRLRDSHRLGVAGVNIIKQIGMRLSKITPSRGLCIELGAAIVVLVGTKFGIPLSTTHCQVGATTGVALLEGSGGVNWRLNQGAAFGWAKPSPSPRSPPPRSPRRACTRRTSRGYTSTTALTAISPPLPPPRRPGWSADVSRQSRSRAPGACTSYVGVVGHDLTRTRPCPGRAAADSVMSGTILSVAAASSHFSAWISSRPWSKSLRPHVRLGHACRSRRLTSNVSTRRRTISARGCRSWPRARSPAPRALEGPRRGTRRLVPACGAAPVGVLHARTGGDAFASRPATATSGSNSWSTYIHNPRAMASSNTRAARSGKASMVFEL